MKLLALHSIVRSRKLTPATVEPNSIFDATADEATTLLAMNAAREPTAEEIALADAHAAQRNAQAAPVQTDGTQPPGPTNRELLEIKANAQAAPVQTDGTQPPGPTNRELLEIKANALGVSFSANIGDEKLAKRINEAEAKASKKPAKSDEPLV